MGTNSITPLFVSGFNGNLGASSDVLNQTGTWTSGAVDPAGHWLVALDSAGKLLQSFQITPIQNAFGSPDGALTAGATLGTGLASPSSVTLDPLGRFVFVSDATAGSITAFAFSSNGTITATGKTTPVSATGTGRVSIDASGTYLYAAVTGNGTSIASGVAAFKINADGSLTAVAGSPFATGASTSGTAGVVVTSSVQ
jgi:6-phosphogluconolactonase (cycloisomerase 2 family)